MGKGSRKRCPRHPGPGDEVSARKKAENMPCTHAMASAGWCMDCAVALARAEGEAAGIEKATRLVDEAAMGFAFATVSIGGAMMGATINRFRQVAAAIGSLSPGGVVILTREADSIYAELRGKSPCGQRAHDGLTCTRRWNHGGQHETASEGLLTGWGEEAGTPVEDGPVLRLLRSRLGER